MNIKHDSLSPLCQVLLGSWVMPAGLKAASIPHCNNKLRVGRAGRREHITDNFRGHPVCRVLNQCVSVIQCRSVDTIYATLYVKCKSSQYSENKYSSWEGWGLESVNDNSHGWVTDESLSTIGNALPIETLGFQGIFNSWQWFNGNYNLLTWSGCQHLEKSLKRHSQVGSC